MTEALRGLAGPRELLAVLLLLAALLTGAHATTSRVALSSAAAAEPPVPPRVTGELVAPGVLRRTLAYGPSPVEQTVDVYAAPDAGTDPRPTVLLLHGGAWAIGDSTEWAPQAVELVQTRGWTAVSLNYTRTPTAPWPAALTDVQAALALLRERAPELGIDPTRIGALGDSAGGHLAALLGRGPQPVQAVVTWSGINDLAALVQQPRSGGCPPEVAGCTPTLLAKRVVEDLFGCTPAQCPQAYRDASPAYGVTAEHPATLAFGSEGEQIDARQAWVMDAALRAQGVPSRVRLLAGGLHARGYHDTAWPESVAFLARVLGGEPVPLPAVAVALDLPERATVTVGRTVPVTGSVSPRQFGSEVLLQVRGADGQWRDAQRLPLERGEAATTFTTTWTPDRPGPTTFRAVWQGSGTVVVTTARTLTAR